MKLKDMKISLTGVIKVDRDTNYGFFTMNTEEVRNKLGKPLDDIKQNMKEKNWKGKLTMCRFTDYGGK